MSVEVVTSFFTRRFLGTLTGGFFYDVHHSLLVNTIHFYFWLFLFIFPLSLYTAGIDNTFNTIFYTILIGVLFLLIKFGAFYLQKAFAHEQKIKEGKTTDKPEVVPEEPPKANDEDNIKDSKREEPITTDDITPTIVEDPPRLTFQDPPATTIPEKKLDLVTVRSDEIKRRDKRHKVEEESDDSTTIVHSSFTATRKSKTSTGAVLGERDSEISSTLDKETSVPWLTEEDTSMKEFSEEELSDNEPKGTDSKETKNNTTINTSIVQPENPNLLDDIRNYAFDDFAFYDESFMMQTPSRRPAPPTIDTNSNTTDDNTEEIKVEKNSEPKKPDTIVSILGKNVALPFDRLFLNHLLDTDDHWFEALLSVALATTCAYLGFRLSPFFHEFSLVMLWYIVACAQYSLLKSPQPDSCSPRHDFNKLNAYNRSFYFILIAMSILLLKDSLRHYDNSVFVMYNIEFSVHRATEISLSVLLNVLPYFPLIYLLGLLPQCNTLVMYIIEQLNIHAFGGSGSTNIRATLFDFFRSWIIVGIIYGIGYASKFERNFLFSLYLGLMVGLSLLHSRLVTDPIQLWNMTSTLGGLIYINAKHEVSLTSPTQSDSPAATLSNYPKKRLYADLVLSLCAAIIATAVHATTVFYYMWPYAFYALAVFGCSIGFVSRYAFTVLRKPFPWNLFQEPILESVEHKMFEPKDAPSAIMWYEKLGLIFNTSEQMIFYPVLFLTAITEGVHILNEKFSLEISVLITSIVGIKLFRGCFGDTSKHFLILFFSLLFFQFDLKLHKETFMLDFFIASILVIKIDEAILKMNFILVYLSPFKMSWGSFAHVLLQPLAVPHFVVTLFQVLASSVISAPLYPFIGSTVFLTGYGRPMRFWEREYKTNRVDNSQIKLSEALDSNSETETNANNLNSIFYEHLVGSLQKTLYKEIQSGRFGNVSSGDFYLIVNDRLTALLHIIDISNGHCTFQLRGMEFKGTYCQERELEAINRQDYTNGDDNKLFPEQLGKLPKLLSFKNMFSFRWRSWEVVNTSLMLQTYSIGLNAASQLINVYSLRMVLIKCYVKAAIFYLLQSPSLESWLSDPVISSHLSSIKKDYADLDPIFTSQIDEDFDTIRDGISIQSFDKIYGSWIQTCLLKRIEKKPSILKEEDFKIGTLLFNFCFAISLLARRCLLVGPSDSTSTYTFMNRFHSLFKGDFRITSTKDEFVLADPDIMHKVLGKAIRISLRLHQDHFIGEEYEDPEELFLAIEEHERTIVCCHEGDPLWRTSVLNDVPMLLSLRKQTDSTAADYNDHMILSLTLRYMKFRVIKLNREGVRGLWAGQVQELVFLGNTNAERGSIQQMRTVVRNLINQSCDFPVGYPIYVSPLTTSYSSFWPDILNGVYYPSFLSSIWAKGHL